MKTIYLKFYIKTKKKHFVSNLNNFIFDKYDSIIHKLTIVLALFNNKHDPISLYTANDTE